MVSSQLHPVDQRDSGQGFAGAGPDYLVSQLGLNQGWDCIQGEERVSASVPAFVLGSNMTILFTRILAFVLVTLCVCVQSRRPKLWWCKRWSAWTRRSERDELGSTLIRFGFVATSCAFRCASSGPGS